MYLSASQKNVVTGVVFLQNVEVADSLFRAFFVWRKNTLFHVTVCFLCGVTFVI